MFKLISLCICIPLLFGCSKKDAVYKVRQIIEKEKAKLITVNKPRCETIDYSRRYPRIIYRIR